jgi:hypothetical protein
METAEVKGGVAPGGVTESAGQWVGTSPCDVPARKAGGTDPPRCTELTPPIAPAWGADGAARRPYQIKHLPTREGTDARVPSRAERN